MAENNQTDGSLNENTPKTKTTSEDQNESDETNEINEDENSQDSTKNDEEPNQDEEKMVKRRTRRAIIDAPEMIFD